MPTIRDVVQALGRRDGVDAVIVLDPDGLAALVPSVVAACNRLGAAAERGGFGTGLVEYQQGLALVAEITPETLLTVFIKGGTNVGSLLYELQRHRAAIADLL